MSFSITAATHRAMVICILLGGWIGQVSGQDLLEELTTTGVQFTPTVQVPMEPPALAGKLTEAELAERKKRLAGNDEWDRFTRDSVVAPVTIKLEYITDAKDSRVGHNVHAAFVVHAKLESIADRDLMEQIFGKAKASSSEASSSDSGLKFNELSAEELAEVGLASGDKQVGSESPETVKKTFSHIEFDLLEKIRLRGVMRVERVSTPNSITVAWRLEPQFGKADSGAATWERIGEKTTEPQPYSGWAGYLNVSRVSEAPEMLMIESRMLLHELPEWFSASNFVRSKLPLAIQESARSFRRKLKTD